jgi:hypothetical protein
MVGGSLRVLRLLPPLKLVAQKIGEPNNSKVFGNKLTNMSKRESQNLLSYRYLMEIDLGLNKLDY